MKLYQEQNNTLLKNFLSRTFFNSWKSWERAKSDKGYMLNNYRGLELDIGDYCDLKCSYCYVNKFGKDYYPDPQLKNPKVVLENTKITLNWLWLNQMRPKIELFGGDAFNQNVGFDIVEEIISRAESGQPVATEIIVPTNMNFLFNEEKVKLVEELINRGKKANCPLFISASVDGIYMEENRSFRNGNTRDDAFYDTLFRFAKKHSIGFHPMIYSKNIDKWWDNFLWFQNKFKEYELPPTNIYLLEVRNAEWSEEESQYLYEFMRKLSLWVSQYLKITQDPARTFFQKKWAFNTLSSPFSQIGRGLGCSLQSGLYLRMGDLTTFPCHRLMYNFFKLFKFIVKDNQVVDIESINPELYIATNSANAVNFPMCEQCIINSMCSHGCLGAQFENTGDMFVPIPSTCRMEFYRIKGILDGFKEGGVLDMILNVVNEEKKNKIVRFMEDVK